MDELGRACRKTENKTAIMKRQILVFYFTIYLGISFLLIGAPIDFDLINNIHISPDPAFHLWCFNWWIYALKNGINPLYTDAFWAPYGINLTWTTSIPALSLFMFPINSSLGTIAAYNITNLISLSISGFVFFLILRQINVSEEVSFFSGLIFILSPFTWGHLLGHINLSTTFIIPIIVYVILLRIKNKISQEKFAIILGLLLVIQFGISKEIFALSLVLGIVSILVYFLFFSEKRKIIKLGSEILYGILIAFIIISPLIYVMLTGSRPEGFINRPEDYSSDLLAFLIPTELNLLFGKYFQNITKNFPGNIAEQTAYLGVLIYFLPFLVLNRKKSIKFLIALFFIFSILSLGPYLHIGGKLYENVKLPWTVFTELPLIKHALPVRISYFTFFVLVLAVGIYLSRIKKFYIRLTLYIAIILSLIPDLSYYRGEKIKIPEFISGKHYVDVLKRDSVVLIFPLYSQLGYQGPVWQYLSGFYFKEAQLFAGVPPKELIENIVTRDFTLYNYTSLNYINDLDKLKISFLHYIIQTNIEAIIKPVDFEDRVVNQLLESLPSKYTAIGDVEIYYPDKNNIKRKIGK